MVFVGSLDETERRDLSRLARRDAGRVNEHICMILLSSRGCTVPHIAANYECDDGPELD
jgi:hypothetical protein